MDKVIMGAIFMVVFFMGNATLWALAQDLVYFTAPATIAMINAWLIGLVLIALRIRRMV